MSKTLDQAIENLYKVFRKYPVNLNMDGSPLYRELEQWNKTLTSKNLRSLSDEDLRIFHFKVMSTWGNIEDFKYYLPRIFELLTKVPNEFEEYVALSKLNYGNWRTWPLDEQQVIDDYLLALWESLVNRNPLEVGGILDDYIAAIADLCKNFNELLAIWEVFDTEYSVENLVVYLRCNKEILLEQKTLPGFCESKNKGEIFYKWITSAKVIKILSNEFFEYYDKHFAEELSDIIQILEKHN